MTFREAINKKGARTEENREIRKMARQIKRKVCKRIDCRDCPGKVQPSEYSWSRGCPLPSDRNDFNRIRLVYNWMQEGK